MWHLTPATDTNCLIDTQGEGEVFPFSGEQQGATTCVIWPCNGFKKEMPDPTW
jgi:hypothetical protein